MSATREDRLEFVVNAVGRRVPTVVNGAPARPFAGVGAAAPQGAKHGPPIRSAADYPERGDNRAPDLRTALERRSGMATRSHWRPSRQQRNWAPRT